MPQEIVEQALTDWKTADIPERTRAALHLLQYLTKHPLELNKPFIADLRTHGLDNHAMEEVANVGFHFNFINRLADTFSFDHLNKEQEAFHTKMLNRTTRLLRNTPPKPSWIKDTDGQIRPIELARARQTLLSAPGEIPPSLRQAIEAFVVTQWGHTRPPAQPVPQELISCLQKLAFSAYKITDDDIAALKTAGYNDDAIYEIAVAGAFGAAIVGVERLFGILYGDNMSMDTMA
ncbi:MAG: hypothetical protein D6706_17830 [Chloroflexi bacterium]|nr:MAG: hypothetical protein D6706_17830 [Chloroflexota bacterium]